MKMEAVKRAKRKSDDWKRRQQEKLKRNIKLLQVGEVLREKVPKKLRKNRRQTNTRKQTTNKEMMKYTKTSHQLLPRKLCTFCIQKRQQSSPAVMFARLKSNRRYKPGD